MNPFLEFLFFMLGLVATYLFLQRMCEEEYMDDE